MTLDLSTEELSAVYVIAAGELQAIKAEEEEGHSVDMMEVETLLAVVNKIGPMIDNPPVTWDQIPALPEDDLTGGD